MSLLSEASAHTDQADLVILSHVETIRDQLQPATASAVASLIGGAPVARITGRLFRLRDFGLVENYPPYTANFQLTEMGAELLRQDLLGWSPSPREEQRRATVLAAMTRGIWQDRMR